MVQVYPLGGLAKIEVELFFTLPRSADTQFKDDLAGHVAP